jgi:uncharacterized protein YhaN
MKIQRAQIDGYGRLSDKDLSFSPGLQVIVGPNERGKSTLRCFIMDMLYGQKSHLSQVLYEESNALRMPWGQPEVYGGTLCYRLDEGQEIEVQRGFHPDDPRISLRDVAEGTDLAEAFETLPNGELDFASRHLGIGKEIFRGVATIGDLGLDSLGDKDALEQIREKLLTLADSAGTAASAEDVLGLLTAYVDGLGRPGSAGRPLPKARAVLAELKAELQSARVARAEVAELGVQRQEVSQKRTALREERHALEGDIRLSEAQARYARLLEAEKLLARIDQTTQQCFAMGAARDFPLDRAEEVERVESRVHTSQLQLDRSQAELRQLSHQLEVERSRGSSSEWKAHGTPLPEKLEHRFLETVVRRSALESRKEELKTALDEGKERVERAQAALTEVPDFGQIGSDPVEWFSQLASSFQMARRARDEECAERDRILHEVEERLASIAEAHALFKEVEEFTENAREYELFERQLAEERKTLADTRTVLEGTRDQTEDSLPGYLFVGVACLTLLAALGAVFVATENHAVFLPAMVLGMASLWSLGSYGLGRLRMKRMRDRIANLEEQESDSEERSCPASALIQPLMSAIDCETVRELEAAHEQYRDASAEISAQAEVLKTQEQKALESEERVNPLLLRLRETFARVGEAIESEEDVQEASANAIGRYQAYREAKRNLSDARAALDRRRSEMTQCERGLEECRDTLISAEAEVREALRQRGFEEDHHEKVEDAIQAYRRRVEEFREFQGRSGMLEERLNTLQAQVAKESAGVEQARLALELLLGQAGVSSISQWQGMAEKAREYQQLWNQRGALEEQLKALLHGEDIHDLRQQVEREDAAPAAPAVAREQQSAELERIAAEADELTQREHALHIAMMERGNHARPISDLEELMANARADLEALELEFEAACHAMALVQDIAGGRHAEMAPVLAKEAGSLLERITQGAYAKLQVADDLSVRVYVSETERLQDSPEKHLSKGTVDQIYFCLRMALLNALHRGGESIPMLLDDPFSNYDDHRLRETMAVLAEAASRNQILLFTCHDDVVRAAEALSAPIMRLE